MTVEEQNIPGGRLQERLDVVLEVVDALSDARRPDVVERFLRRAMDLTGSPRATLFRRDGHEVVTIAGLSDVGSATPVGARFPVTVPAFADAMASGVPLATVMPMTVVPEWFRTHLHVAELQSLTVPMSVSGEVAFVLSLTREGVPFDAEEIETASLLARLAAVALLNADLYASSRDAGRTLRANLRELRARRREVALLLATARRVTASLDLAVIQRELLRATAEMVSHGPAGRRRAALYLVSGGEAVLVREHDETGFSVGSGSHPLSEHPGMRRALRQRRPSVARIDETEPLAALAMRGGVRSVASAPLRAGSEEYVLVAGARDDRPFSSSELRLLQGIADVGELAFGNALRLALERERASELQQHVSRMSELEQMKSEFLNLASHELRGPLGVIRGYLSMLEEAGAARLEPWAAQAMSVMSGKVEEMSRLVEEMLDTARLEESRSQPELVDVDLVEVVHSVVDGVRPLLVPEHSVAVEAPRRLAVRADPAQLRAILFNLVDNARKYSPGGGRITVSVAADGDFARVAVADQGIGIAADDQAKLFKRFQRVVPAENASIPGSGLGLYLARQFARLHGGEIEVRSQPGAGSTFTLRLPRRV